MKQQFIKYLTGAALVFFLCGKALAGGTLSIGYSQYNLSNGVDLAAAYGSIGHEFALGENVSFTPEFRLGTGVNSDRVFRSSVKINGLYGLAGRFNVYATDQVYFFATASYVNYEFKVGGSTVSSWEGGLGVGAGFYFTESLGLELMYEQVDGSPVGSAAMRFRF